jgi:biotin synthase-related radical SAM superfamily protein
MDVDVKSRAYKKAMLIAGGDVKIAQDFKPPYRLSRSTAGPGAGHASIILSFDGTRVRKSVSRESGEFELIQIDDGYGLRRKGEAFIDEVEIQPVIFHAPEQAFFNLGGTCIFDCRFCNTSYMNREYNKSLDPEKIIEMVIEASHRPDFRSVALTSPVVGSVHGTVMKLAYIISVLREKLDPRVPIGVEPYVDDLEDITRLRAAGADEIKLNIETFDRDIFQKVCGKLDYDQILRSIRYAVSVFGREKVTSNIIYGMGETDENVIEGVETLARMGCLANLRPLQLDQHNRGRLEEVLGELEPVTPERMVHLAMEQKQIFILYDISLLNMKTMCGACHCCDLVPFLDL